MAICSESRIEALFANGCGFGRCLIDLYEENKIPFVLLTYGYGTAGSKSTRCSVTADPRKSWLSAFIRTKFPTLL